MSNIIDLSDYRPPKTASEILDELHERLAARRAGRVERASDELRERLAALRTDAREWERSWLRQRVRRLENQLRAERHGQFDDEGVYATAVSLSDEASGTDQSFAATAVARRLLRCPSHSAVVRVGLCLSRLEKAGRVERIPQRDHRPNRWRLS